VNKSGIECLHKTAKIERGSTVQGPEDTKNYINGGVERGPQNKNTVSQGKGYKKCEPREHQEKSTRGGREKTKWPS